MRSLLAQTLKLSTLIKVKVLKGSFTWISWSFLEVMQTENSETEIVRASITQRKRQKHQGRLVPLMFYMTRVCEYPMVQVEASEASCVMGTAPVRNCWADSQEQEMRANRSQP